MKLCTKHKELLGTVIKITLPQFFSSLFSPCFAELQRIQSTYSRFEKTSPLSTLNNNLNSWHPVTDEFLFLVKTAVHLHKKTKGHFDITLKSTLDSLGYNTDYSFEEKKIKQSITQKIREKIQRPIKINNKTNEIFLRKEIDFGGFGKGFALDKLATLLDKHHVTHYSINAGGDIYSKKGIDQQPWTTLLEHPDNPKKAIGHVELDSQAIASSSSNRRKWGTHHHLLNAKSKKPEQSVKATWIVAKSGLIADAYATACFTAGFERGCILLDKSECEGLIISKDNTFYATPEFSAKFYE